MSQSANTNESLGESQSPYAVAGRRLKLGEVGNLLENNLRVNGFHVIAKSLPPRLWFQKLYETYDRVLDELQHDPVLIEDLDDHMRAWQAVDDNKDYLGGTPPTFRDRGERADKEDKTYFQFSRAFYTSRFFAGSLIAKLPAMKELLGYMSELHDIAARLFGESFLALEEDHPGITRAMSVNATTPPIVVKAIRYNANPERFAENNAHYDKSALTLILNSDDPDTLVRVAPFNASGVSRKSFCKAVDYPASLAAPNDATLISGLCLQEAGFPDLAPTPHYILPIDRPYARHSVVAFYLVPGMCTESFLTKVPFIENGSAAVVSRNA